MHLTSDPEQLQQYLIQNNWMEPGESVLSVEKPGEGNMNFTLRVRTSRRSLIVKQSRAFVEKYPQIAAPADRALLEGRFYQKIALFPSLQARMPQLYSTDAINNVLVLEDLGDARDYTFLYQPGQMLPDEATLALTAYLSELHGAFLTDEPEAAFANPGMRQLNHEHIFRYPFLEETGLDLDAIQPGLKAVALPFKRDEALQTAVRNLGELYFPGKQTGPSTLLHGDYYPGSWLQTAAGVRVIDPEFAFYGPAEFDLGVLVAHLFLAAQPDSVHQQALAGYQKPSGFDDSLRRQFTGVEIIRRLIGLAQLPVSLSVEAKKVLLEEARDMILQPTVR